MKKVLFIMLFLLELLTATAQRFNAGIVSGLNISQIDGDYQAGYNLLGVNFGGLVEINLNKKKWSTSLEILYSGEGAKNSKIYLFELSKARLNLIKIPLYVNYYKSEKWKFSLGGMYGRLFNYKLEDLDKINISNQYGFKEDFYYLIGGITFYINQRIGLSTFASISTNFQRDFTLKPLYSRPLSLSVIYQFKNSR